MKTRFLLIATHHPYNAQLRAALNPRVQVSAYYQYNSFGKLDQWNARASWEFAPLSFICLVYNKITLRIPPLKINR
jgi:hypothetical protein